MTWLAEPAAAWALLVLVGVIAGVVNTLAGGGSFLALPLLMAMGVPAGAANGTVRIGVVLQSLVAALTFHRSGVRDWGVAARLVVPMTVGAVGGSMLAARADDAVLRPIFGGMFLAWAVLLAVRPGRFLAPATAPRSPGPASDLLCLLVGVYGGFLQAGVGFPLIALLVSFLGHDPVRANAIKVFCVGVYTLVALPVLALAGRVEWLEGTVLAAGTMLGAWLGTRWQLRAGAGLVRWFVLVTVAVAGAAMIADAL